MVTDILIRAGIEEASNATPVDKIVAISMCSNAVTAQIPQSMLIISSAWERFLRATALDAVWLIKPTATEGEKVFFYRQFAALVLHQMLSMLVFYSVQPLKMKHGCGSTLFFAE